MHLCLRSAGLAAQLLLLRKPLLAIACTSLPCIITGANSHPGLLSCSVGLGVTPRYLRAASWQNTTRAAQHVPRPTSM